MDPKIKNFLEQVNRASDGQLAEDFPDPYPDLEFVGGPTPDHPECGYLVVPRKPRGETAEQWRERAIEWERQSKDRERLTSRA